MGKLDWKVCRRTMTPGGEMSHITIIGSANSEDAALEMLKSYAKRGCTAVSWENDHTFTGFTHLDATTLERTYVRAWVEHFD